ncbi:MAG TPA: co-chaperone GroES [Candidatus Nanoarchaeia archaeon]|nr:co-chaperone GroES [Candidatus Nanoarchaeia archaeon]
MKNKKKGSASKPVSKNSQSTPKNNSKIQPLGDRVLIKPFFAEEDKNKNNFGIIMPDTVNKEQPEQGEVLAVGEGRYEDGKIVPLKVKVGDTVIFSKYGFDEVKTGDQSLYILKEDSILAIVK